MAFLIIMSGEMKRHRFEIDQDEISIGRADGNVILLNDSSVSGQHCCVRREGRKYTIYDLDSTNGTLLNNKAIKESRLKPKDIIKLGSVEIMFDGEDIDVVDESAINTTPGIPPTAVTSPQSFTLSTSTVFGARRETKNILLAIIATLGIFALGALGWFVFNLFKS